MVLTCITINNGSNEHSPLCSLFSITCTSCGISTQWNCSTTTAVGIKATEAETDTKILHHFVT